MRRAPDHASAGSGARPTPEGEPVARRALALQALAVDVVLDVLDYALTWVAGSADGRPPHTDDTPAPRASA
jgi:hypothetical protein